MRPVAGAEFVSPLVRIECDVIIELRVYEIAPGQMEEMHRRFRDHILPLFEKHGFAPIFIGVPEIGYSSNELIYALSFESLGAREEAWKAFHSDLERRAYKANLGPVDPVVLRFRSSVFVATNYSPVL